MNLNVLNPVTVVSGVVQESESCLDFGKRACILLPIPLLALDALGGCGFAFATAFGSSTATATATATATGASLSSAAIANIAYDGFSTLTALFACGCYYYNLPEKTFEENVKRQARANLQLEKIETEVDGSISKFAVENQQLRNQLQIMEEKMRELELALKTNGDDLVARSNELKEITRKLDETKSGFKIAHETVNGAKELVVSMMGLSQKMQKNVKSSKVALQIFQQNNHDLDDKLKRFDLENVKLTDLLGEYSKIVKEEHIAFQQLAEVCDKLNATCERLQREVAELSKDSKQIASDVQIEMNNTKQLEILEDKLEHIIHDI